MLENIVKPIIATFAVFTGFTLNLRLQNFNIAGWLDPTLWTFVIVATLLLRYIIGSSFHLNYMYVQQNAAGHSRSKSSGLLFKDLFFLVVFGILAVQMAKSVELRDLLCWASWFIATWLIWVIVDYPLRALWAKVWKDEEEPAPRSLLGWWAAIDVVQLGLTLGFLALWPAPSICAIIALGVIYIVALWCDFRVLVEGHP